MTYTYYKTILTYIIYNVISSRLVILLYRVSPTHFLSYYIRGAIHSRERERGGERERERVQRERERESE
jgi:hypothetical protein